MSDKAKTWAGSKKNLGQQMDPSDLPPELTEEFGRLTQGINRVEKLVKASPLFTRHTYMMSFIVFPNCGGADIVLAQSRGSGSHKENLLRAKEHIERMIMQEQVSEISAEGTMQ